MSWWTSAQVVDAVIAKMGWPSKMNDDFRKIPGPPSGERLAGYDLEDVLTWMDNDLGDEVETKRAAAYMVGELRILAFPSVAGGGGVSDIAGGVSAIALTVPTGPAVAGGGASGGRGPFRHIEELLHANWKEGDMFTADGQRLRAKLPSFTADPDHDAATAANEASEDEEKFCLFRDQADHWVYPASTPPSIGNGSHLCAAVVQAHDSDNKEDLTDFAIRVCVYLTGASEDLIPRLKTAASSLDDKTRKSILTYLDEDAPDPDYVSKILRCEALLTASGMKASEVDGLCGRYAQFMGLKIKFSSFEEMECEQSPWDRPVTLPLFNPVSSAGSDHWQNAWNVERFTSIFADYMGRCKGAEVRLLPPWGRPQFPKTFQNKFRVKAVPDGAYHLDRVFSPWLFERSFDDDRLKRSTEGVPDYATAVSLVTFNQLKKQGHKQEPRVTAGAQGGGGGGGGAAAAGGADGHTQRPPNVLRYELEVVGSQALAKEVILVVNKGNEYEFPEPPPALLDRFTADSVPPVLTTATRRLEQVARSTVSVVVAEEAKLDFVGEMRGSKLAAKAGRILVTPKPFQRLAIPYALSGANVIVASETGSGKTLVFLMSVFMNAFPAAAEANPRGLRALVIVPTGLRPLVHQHVTTFGRVAERLKENDDPFWKNVAAPKDSVASKPEKGGTDLFRNALIRIDTPHWISTSLDGKKYSDKDAGGVKVIAIDEVDKCLQNSKDKSDVERIAMRCPSAQIISASATVVRQAELEQKPPKTDEVAEWLSGKAFRTTRRDGPPRGLVSIQTENVMPSSVFHLFVDLRGGPGKEEEVQLAWEKMITCKDAQVFGREESCLIVWNENASMQEKKAAIANQRIFFRDKDTDASRPNLAHMNNKLTLQEKKAILDGLMLHEYSGCLGTYAVGTGLDVPFAAVSFSRPGAGQHFIKWDQYVHASGRCGRRPNELGLSTIFIKNNEDAKKWESMFQVLLAKQPDLCERVGVVRVGNAPPNSTFQSFFGHVGPLPVKKPSPSSNAGNFCISNNLTDQHDAMFTVAKLFLARSGQPVWPKSNPAAAASAEPVQSIHVATSEMQVYFGPWVAPYSSLTKTFPWPPSSGH